TTRMPAETDTWRKVVLRIGERLAVIAQSQVQRKIAAQVNVVLHEDCVEPLWQFVAANAEIDRLRVALNISKRQLIEWFGAGQKSKRTEDRRSGFAASPTRGVMNNAASKSQVVFSKRPRHGVRELNLMAPQIRRA